jgi:hypothetical protein
MHCQKCGYFVSPPDDNFCTQCGNQLKPKPTPGHLPQAVFGATADTIGVTEAQQKPPATPAGSKLLCRARCTQTKQPFAVKFELADQIWYSKTVG